MQSVRRALLLVLIVGFAVISLPSLAQQVIATVPVGIQPWGLAVNSITNKIYVANSCDSNPNGSCSGGTGTVTVIDGATDNTLSVSAGYFTNSVALNPVTNRIYAVNQCSDESCGSGGSVTVMDGTSNTVIATVAVGNGPYGVAVNSVTNKIYVVNVCANDPTCGGLLGLGTVSVIDGVSNTVVATVNVGTRPSFPVINTVTNKIYVANECGNDPSCQTFNGTVTVIDGVTNGTTSVNVAVFPRSLDVNPVTNKIYVVNQCGDAPNCVGAGTPTVTVIDGTTLATTEFPIGGFEPNAIAVNPITNKIYVPSRCTGDPSCQRERMGTVSVIDGGTLAYTSTVAQFGPYSVGVDSVTNKIYVANQCGREPDCINLSPAKVTVVDGVSLAVVNLDIGVSNIGPNSLAINSATNRIYVTNSCGTDPSCQTHNGTVSVIDGTPIPPTPLQFVPLSQPCRAVDTRPENGGDGPIPADHFLNTAISGAGNCGVFASAAAYSLNVSVVPQGRLNYLTVWSAGQRRPLASTLNSLDGRIKANAAIVAAGDSGKINLYATDTTNVVVDVNGYFAPVSPSTLAFYPLPPCRIADTRNSTYPQGLGPPFLPGGVERQFPIRNATACNIPTGVAAYSLNFSVVPHGSLFYMTVWPTGETSACRLHPERHTRDDYCQCRHRGCRYQRRCIGLPDQRHRPGH